MKSSLSEKLNENKNLEEENVIIRNKAQDNIRQ